MKGSMFESMKFDRFVFGSIRRSGYIRLRLTNAMANVRNKEDGKNLSFLAPVRDPGHLSGKTGSSTGYVALLPMLQ